MDNGLTELIKQAPNLAGLIFIVVTFLRHIKDGQTERAKDEAEKHKAFAEVIERNTHALERNSEFFGRASQTYDHKQYNGTHKGQS
jgi:hypothetical protein